MAIFENITENYSRKVTRAHIFTIRFVQHLSNTGALVIFTFRFYRAACNADAV